MNNFNKQMLDSHNKYRDLHQTPPLTFDQALAEAAQKWADRLAEKDDVESDLACRSEMGENVAMKFSSVKKDFPGGEFTDYWYATVAKYDFSGSTPVQPGSPVLSFSQLVWKSSTKMGAGKAVSKTGKVYAVARYSPGGNCVGQFADNVLPTRDGKLPDFVTKQAGGDGQEIVEKIDDPRPTIGGKHPEDVLIEASKITRIEGFKKVVTLVERYRSADGSTYTREKKREYTGALRK
ncbi:hypothetical protein BOX15_Mlig003433g1 [Macrostomum lignano]|uniref:Uncharacterized protein n=2 Tax=Macrostomum lignano TaxID=282301 RepID=A0A267EUT6_9PLAT|nr:hypothetical protein BOX15_Mlig003433g2 [Macrostomum lignano]PAA69221.1 hypothetical protein BOX15_Mlig003433g1 [Macrostomum lignano]